MSRFTSHFKMNENDAVEYVREKLPDMFAGDELSCEEIGDGNINYVFKIKEVHGDRSVIVKHADIAARLTGQHVSTDRNRIEANILTLEDTLAPGFVPKLYFYDPVMCCMVMEDVSDHQNMRYAMMEHKTFSTFAGDITDFMAKTLVNTSDNVISPAKKKKLVSEYTNPDLCDVTETLVYTFPYFEDGAGNSVYPQSRELVRSEIYEDKKLHLEAAKLKEEFKSNAQALIHGDLHSGSIFVKEGSTKVLDPEFAFYGPAGYDVGNVLAHLIFAWVNARYTMPEGEDRVHFMQWCEGALRDTVDLFCKKAAAEMKSKATDRMAQTEGFAEWYVSCIMTSAAGTAGLELIRRIVGVAKVRDITVIEEPGARAAAERLCIMTAKGLIMNRARIVYGDDWLNVLKAAAKDQA
ncbi:MAG: S-methyl-5-thioribose kinase [Subdoligranulum sp.]|nr:S-methyl-5-thioribose kinase [Subdoligranulum sp.]